MILEGSLEVSIIFYGLSHQQCFLPPLYMMHSVLSTLINICSREFIGKSTFKFSFHLRMILSPIFLGMSFGTCGFEVIFVQMMFMENLRSIEAIKVKMFLCFVLCRHSNGVENWQSVNIRLITI